MGSQSEWVTNSVTNTQSFKAHTSSCLKNLSQFLLLASVFCTWHINLLGISWHFWCASTTGPLHLLAHISKWVSRCSPSQATTQTSQLPRCRSKSGFRRAHVLWTSPLPPSDRKQHCLSLHCIFWHCHPRPSKESWCSTKYSCWLTDLFSQGWPLNSLSLANYYMSTLCFSF